MKLKELQKEFVEFIYSNKKSSELFSDIKATSVKESLNVYRSSSNLGLIEALKSTFHSAYLILGEKSFEKLAEKYVKQHPSQHGTLDLYGFLFPGFIYDNKVKPSYMFDMLKLDLEHHLSFISADYKSCSVEEFKNIPQDKYENVIFTINPTSTICELDYDVLDYWKYLRDTEKPKASLKITKQKNHVIIGRSSSHYIFAHSLNSIEIKFINLCKSSTKLLDTFQTLDAFDPNFDFQKTLKKLIENQIIVSFTLN